MRRLRDGTRPVLSRLGALAAGMTLSACGGGGGPAARDAGAAEVSGMDAAADVGATDARAIDRDGGAYLPPRIFPVAVHDGYRVRDRGRGIEFPIRVRFPRGATGPLPLVVLSHGGLSNPRGHEGLDGWGEAFARAGYVAINMAHVGADAPTAMCTSLGVPVTECELDDFQREVSAGGTLPPPLYYRPLDARAVLDDLAGIEAAAGVQIDRTRMGLGGHSGGTQAPMRAAGAVIDVSASARAVRSPEPRFRAFFAASPQGIGRLGFTASSWESITAPVLVLTGSADNSAGEQAAARRDAFRGMRGPDKYELFLDTPGATHALFSLGNEAASQATLGPILASSGVAFMDAYLRDSAEARAWLTSNAVARWTGGVATMSAR